MSKYNLIEHIITLMTSQSIIPLSLTILLSPSERELKLFRGCQILQAYLRYFNSPNPPIVWELKCCLQYNHSPKEQRRGCKILREWKYRVTPAHPFKVKLASERPLLCLLLYVVDTIPQNSICFHRIILHNSTKFALVFLSTRWVSHDFRALKVPKMGFYFISTFLLDLYV